MGISIHLSTPLEAEWEPFRSSINEQQSFWLSRRFYTFMITRNLQEIPAELDQIAELTGIDIQPLYEMMDYYEEQDLESQLEYEKDKERAEAARRENALAKEKLNGNINRV